MTKLKKLEKSPTFSGMYCVRNAAGLGNLSKPYYSDYWLQKQPNLTWGLEPLT